MMKITLLIMATLANFYVTNAMAQTACNPEAQNCGSSVTGAERRYYRAGEWKVKNNDSTVSTIKVYEVYAPTYYAHSHKVRSSVHLGYCANDIDGEITASKSVPGRLWGERTKRITVYECEKRIIDKPKIEVEPPQVESGSSSY